VPLPLRPASLSTLLLTALLTAGAAPATAAVPAGPPAADPAAPTTAAVATGGRDEGDDDGGLLNAPAAPGGTPVVSAPSPGLAPYGAGDPLLDAGGAAPTVPAAADGTPRDLALQAFVVVNGVVVAGAAFSYGPRSRRRTRLRNQRRNCRRGRAGGRR